MEFGRSFHSGGDIGSQPGGEQVCLLMDQYDTLQPLAVLTVLVLTTGTR